MYDKTLGDGPLGKKLSEYAANGRIAFHMPGHKRSGEFSYLGDSKNFDVTEIDGLDDLHAPRGVIAESEERAAKLFQAKATRFLVNGSTAGILAGIRTLSKAGDGVLVAANCHKSVFNAAEICRSRVDIVMPEVCRHFFTEVTPEAVERKLKECGAKLVVVTSPTYEGVISDIRGISEVCRASGAKLLVDEAHGSHLGLFGIFPESARTQGADIVVNSLHKTLPSLTQTAIVSVTGDADVERLDESLAMFESSSPSYVLMASIDGCVDFIATRGKEELSRWKRLASEFSRNSFENFRLYEHGGAYDVSKQVIIAKNMSGPELMRRLRARGLELETAGADYALAMTGMGNGKEDFDALSMALREIDELQNDYLCRKNAPFYLPPLEKICEAYEIDAFECEYVPIGASAGRVAAENVVCYPPASPVTIKGRRISEEAANYLVGMASIGVSVRNARDGLVKVAKGV